MAEPATAQSRVPDIGIKMLPEIQVNPADAVGALTDFIGAKKEEYEARNKAIQQNTQIQTDLAASQDVLTTNTIKAYDDLRKSAALPPGLVKILGLFDSSYNSQANALQIEENQVKGQQAAARAQTLIGINNQVPDLKAAQAAALEQNFKLQQNLFTLSTDVTKVNQGTLALKLQTADLSIKLNEEDRKQMDTALKSMTLPQAQAELKRAQKGEGDFANFQGFLEDRIDSEEKADLAHKEALIALEQHKQSLAQGDINLQNSTFDLLQKKLRNVASTIPASVAEPKIVAAQAKGDINITFGTGKDAITLPTNVVAEEFNKNNATDAAAKLTAITNAADQTAARVDRTTTVAANLASSDKRAANEYALINRAMQDFNPQDAGSIRQLNAIMGASEARLAVIQKDVEGTYKTPEAKAAVGQFFANGKFTLPGATEVVHNITGIPGAAASMKFGKAQQMLDNAYADAIAKQNITGMPAFTGSQASQNQIMTWALAQQGKTKDTLTELKSQVLSNPVVAVQVGNAINAQYENSAVGFVLGDLTKGPQAGVFNQILKMLDNPATDPNNELHFTQQDVASGKFPGSSVGNVSTQKMQLFLERQSVLTKYAADYNKTFLDALQARAVASANGSGGDPSHTINDSALETHIFGAPHAQTAYSDFLGKLRTNAGAVHAEMQKAIEADKSADARTRANTIDDTVTSASGGYGLTPKQYEAIKAQEQQRQNVTGMPQPSATGIPMTSSNYIKRLYDGGN